MPDDRPQTPNEAEKSLSSDAVEQESMAVPTPTQEARAFSWRSAWQLPLLVVSVGLIGAGIWFHRNGSIRPDPGGMLASASHHMLEGRYSEAEQLHDEAATLIGVDDDLLNSELHVGRADLEARRPPSERDDQGILDSYDAAMALGRELEAEQRARRAGALAALGQYEPAFDELLGEVGDTSLERVRYRIMNGLVGNDEAGDPDLVSVMAPALDQYAAVAGRNIEHAIWAALTSARMRLTVGDTTVGIEVMQRAMRRLDIDQDEDDGTDWKGRMYAVYGRLWLESGDRNAARGPLEIALVELPVGDEDRRRSEAALAWIEFAEGEHERAIRRFSEIIASNPEPSTLEQARLWRAEASSAIADFETAEADYRFLLERPFHQSGLHARRLLQSLGDRVREAMLRSEPERAITFAEMALQSGVFGFNEELLNHAAGAHRALGEKILKAHSDEVDLMLIPVDAVPEEQRREAASRFRRAGELYERLAVRFRGDISRRDVWVSAQRSTAECYDLGAHGMQAIRAYRDYLSSTTAEDLERAHVAFRYARVLHAAGRIQEALEAYDDLVSKHESMPDAANKARVDAARCLIALGRNQEARARLEAIVRGLPKGPFPDSIGFREAKFALGRLLTDIKDWSDAISTLSEILRRYPDDPRLQEAAFNLGYAHQQAASGLVREMEDPTITPSRRSFIRTRHAEHLDGAVDAYGQVIAVYDAQEKGTLDPLEQDRLRDAAIGQADCAFDLGNHQEAIDLYEQIERRYRKEATSLGALVRLVQIWDQLGNSQMADKAHRQAELRLAQLPESAFTFPESSFDRESWRIWIERRPMRGMRVGVGE
ncbi:MAG: tetratricopeptide repeat protein [Phycisphaerales bacterium]|nr:tetratricopeptide repeat protein [Phycisphaerales bacterium]